MCSQYNGLSILVNSLLFRVLLLCCIGLLDLKWITSVLCELVDIFSKNYLDTVGPNAGFPQNHGIMKTRNQFKGYLNLGRS